MTWRRHLAAAVLLSCLGCASTTMLERGHRLVAQQQYRAALTAYQQAANENPSDEAAKRYLRQITPYAIGQAETATSEAVQSGQWEDAAAGVSYVRGLDEERGAALEAEVTALLGAAVDGLMFVGDHERAYRLAARAKGLFPTMKQLPPLLTRLRAHYVALSDTHATAGRYRAALTALDFIEHNEPMMKDRLGPRRHAVRLRWADAVASHANHAEDEAEPGAAAALYGRAFEIAGRDEDASSMRRVVGMLRDEGRFLLELSTSGDEARRDSLDAAIRARARAIDGVTLAEDRDTSTMATRIQLEPVACDQRETFSQAEHEYVAGHRDVPNPSWETLDDQLQQLSTSLSRLRHEAATRGSAADRASRDAQRELRQRCHPAEVALGSAQATHSQAEQRVRRLKSRLDSTRGPQRKRLRQQLRDAERALSDAARELRDAEREHDDAHRRCDVLVDRANAALAAAAEVRGELQATHGQLEMTEQQQRATPRTISEPIMDTMSYQVRHVTRRCGGAVWLELDPAWAAPSRRPLEASATTSDTTHRAYRRYDLDADPLTFAKSDAQLEREANRRAADGIDSVLRARVGDYYQRMADRAASTDDPHLATAIMIALAAAAPTQLDDEHHRRFAAHLKRHYGLESVATLIH